MNRNIEGGRFHGEKGFGKIATAVGMVAALGVGAIGNSAINRKTSVESTSPTTSPTATVTPEATVTPTLEATPTPTEVRNAEAVVIPITAENAAKNYGADAYSTDPSNWEINEYGGAHLKETSRPTVVKANGAVVETYIDLQGLNIKFPAQTEVIHPSFGGKFRSKGGTFWNFGADTDAGFNKILADVRAKEPIEQPGVFVLPVCEPKSLPNSSPEVNHITAEEAAGRYGADAYSTDPSNWDINEWGGAHLKETDKPVIVRATGSVVETYVNLQGLNIKFPAQTEVIHPSYTGVFRSNGGTFWDFGDNTDAGYDKILADVRKKEPKEQPGVFVLPVGKC